MEPLEYFNTVCSRDPEEYPKGKNGKFRCPCCEHFTLDGCNEFNICPVCWWEDDGSINDDDFGGPNGMTLAEGKKNYAEFGDSDGIPAHREKGRLPLPDELK